MMFIVLFSFLVFAQEPSPQPIQPTTEEKKMDVTAKIRVMVPKDGFVKLNTPTSVIISLQNNASTASTALLNDQTVQTTLTLPNGETQTISIPWSTQKAHIEVGNSFAAFGRLSLVTPGNYTLRFWWTPSGPPSKEPTQTIELVVQ